MFGRGRDDEPGPKSCCGRVLGGLMAFAALLATEPAGAADPFLRRTATVEVVERVGPAVVNITTGGGLGMTVEQRLAAPLKAEPELCSLNMGSMNFALHPLANKYKEWKHDWEKPFLEASDDFIFRNTFRDIAYILKHLGEGCGTRFEHECYDVGHLYNLAHFVDRGLIKPPFFVQMIFCILGGIGTDIFIARDDCRDGLAVELYFADRERPMFWKACRQSRLHHRLWHW